MNCLLSDLLNNGIDESHGHVNDREYQHEITVAIYDENNFESNSFHPRIIKLMKEVK